MTRGLHLVYHYVREGGAPGANCPPERLRRQIRYLVDEDYTFLTCRNVATALRNDASLPEKYVVLTFDDGLKEHRETVLPILTEFGIPATFFVIGCTLEYMFPPVIGFQVLIEKLGAERMEKEVLPAVLQGTRYAPLVNLVTLEWLNQVKMRQGEPPHLRVIKYIFNDILPRALQEEKLAEMFARYMSDGAQEGFAAQWFLDDYDIGVLEDCGMEIGAHSMTHPRFTAIGLREVYEEIRESYERLERMERPCREPANSFAYPFGEVYSDKIRREVMRYFSSAWNYLVATPYMSLPPYELNNMPRIDEYHCAFFKDF